MGQGYEGVGPEGRRVCVHGRGVEEVFYMVPFVGI